MNKFFPSGLATTNENVLKPASKPVLANNNKRRVLGDITNAIPEEGRGILNKKISVSNMQSSVAPMDVPASDRFYMNRPCDDIDSRDNDNPLLATDYVNDMYENFNEVEQKYAVKPNYMVHQEFINDKMRSILVDWLVEVHLKFKMVPETLYITVQTIDRYLELKQVRRSRLQLVGVAALLLAAKYEEIYPPELKELVFITDSAYTNKEILEMENEIAVTLDYNFTVPTIHTFLCRYLKAAHADRAMVQLTCYLTERSLQEYSLLRFLPSTIAASAVLIARSSLKRHPWSPTLLKYTKYDEQDLQGCIEEMRKAILDPNNQSQQAVFRKYASTKFGAVSKLPLSFN